MPNHSAVLGHGSRIIGASSAHQYRPRRLHVAGWADLWWVGGVAVRLLLQSFTVHLILERVA